jgi:hypothetical protein
MMGTPPNQGEANSCDVAESVSPADYPEHACRLRIEPTVAMTVEGNHTVGVNIRGGGREDARRYWKKILFF